jgi:hypothetical protein
LNWESSFLLSIHPSTHVISIQERQKIAADIVLKHRFAIPSQQNDDKNHTNRVQIISPSPSPLSNPHNREPQNMKLSRMTRFFRANIVMKPFDLDVEIRRRQGSETET